MSDKKEASVGFSGILAAAAIGLLAGLVVVLSVALFYLEFSGLTVDSVASGYLGTLGDFVGGILNPIAAVLSVGLLAYTLHQNSEALNLTRQELAETREELKKQAQASGELAENSKIQLDLLFDQLRINEERVREEQFLQRYKMLSNSYESFVSKPLLKISGEYSGMTINEALLEAVMYRTPVVIVDTSDDHKQVAAIVGALMPVVAVLEYQTINITSYVDKEYGSDRRKFILDFSFIMYEMPLRINGIASFLRKIEVCKNDRAGVAMTGTKDIKFSNASINSLIEKLDGLNNRLFEIAASESARNSL